MDIINILLYILLFLVHADERTDENYTRQFMYQIRGTP